MAKVKEFPFASLSVTRLLNEVRQELDEVELAHLVDEKDKTIAALTEASKVAQAGVKDMKAQEVESLREAGDRLSRAVQGAAKALVKGDKGRVKAKHSEAETALREALGSLKALAEHAAGTRREALSVLTNRSRQQAEALEDMTQADNAEDSPNEKG